MADDRDPERRVARAAAAWPGLRIGERITEGDRSAVWRGDLDGVAVSVRASRRSDASLAWELDLLRFLDKAGVGTAVPIPTRHGDPHVERVVVQPWIDGGEPESEPEWRAVAEALQRVHVVANGRAQRPDCCVVTELRDRLVSVDADLARAPQAVVAEVCAVFDEFVDVSTSVIHGDTHAGNIRMTSNGVVLLDFDESRVDLVWHDLSNLGVQILDDADHARALRLSDAWEAINAWIAEPGYAKRRLAALRSAGDRDAP